MRNFFKPKYHWYDWVGLFGLALLGGTLMSDPDGVWSILCIGVAITCLLQPALHAGEGK